MTQEKGPREFEVTRTKDNHQLGLSVLISSLELGETKVFIERSAYTQLLEQAEKLVCTLKSVRDFSTIYEHPEHELRHALAVELPHEIDEALKSWTEFREGNKV